MILRSLLALALVTVSACGDSPTSPSGPPWTHNGSGDAVFDMPDIDTVRVTGSFPGNSSNFIVWVGPSNQACGVTPGANCRLLVNELLGTSWGTTTYTGTLQTGGGGRVSVTNSSGVTWTFTEVR